MPRFLHVQIHRCKNVAYPAIALVMILMSFNGAVINLFVEQAAADDENPEARMSVLSIDRLTVPSLNGIECQSPWFVDMNEDGMLDIVAHRKDTGEIYCGRYDEQENENDRYNWFRLLELSGTTTLQNNGNGNYMDDCVPMVVNLFEFDSAEYKTRHLLVSTSTGLPVLYETNGNINHVSSLPEYRMVGYLSGVTSRGHIAVADLDGDEDADIIAAETDGDSTTFRFYENHYNEDDSLWFSSSSTSGIPVIEDGRDVFPYLSRYGDDEYYSLFITSGNSPDCMTEIFCSSDDPTQWTRTEPILASMLNFERCGTVRMGDFNEEMTGLTGLDYGSETGGFPEVLAKSSEGKPIYCISRCEISTDDQTLPIRLTEGSKFWVSGEGSTDPQDDELTFEWDFGEEIDPVEGKSVNHIYACVDPEFDNPEERYDEFSLRLTVDDGDNMDTVTTNVRVFDFIPIPVIEGVRYITYEGISSTYTLSLEDSSLYQGSDELSSDNVDLDALEWDIDYNGQFEVDYTGSECVLPEPNEPGTPWGDNGEHCLALKVSDSDWGEGETPIIKTLDITVLNMKPNPFELSLDPDKQVQENTDGDYPIYNEIDSEIRDTGIALFAREPEIPDPGIEDTVIKYQWSVNDVETPYIDNFLSTSATMNFNLGPDYGCEFDNGGTYRIKVRVMDDDGAWSDWSNVVLYRIEDSVPAYGEIKVLSGVNEENEVEENIPVTFKVTDLEPGYDDIEVFRWDFDYDGITFDIDRTTYANRGGEETTKRFYASSDDSPRNFNVAVGLVDSDDSTLIVNLSRQGNCIKVLDSGFIEDGENASSVVSDYTGEIPEGAPLKFLASMTPVYDRILKYQWDFNYTGIPSEFEYEHETSAREITHFYSTFLDGEEQNGVISVDMAVRAIDIDGSISSPAVIEEIEVRDGKPVAAITGPDRGISGPDKFLTFDARGSISRCDGISYEWDFDYKGTFNPGTPDFILADADIGGSVVGKSFTETGERRIAVRVKETIRVSGNDFDIAEMTVEIGAQAHASLCFHLGNPADELLFIDENKGFFFDATDSEPYPEPKEDEGDDYVEYSWDFDGDGSYDFSTTNPQEVSLFFGRGLASNIIHEYTDRFEGELHRYEIYEPALRIYQKVDDDVHESVTRRKIYVRDARPEAPLQADSESLTFKTINGEKGLLQRIYITPCETVRFMVPESREQNDYPDVVNEDRKMYYQWTDDYIGVHEGDASNLDGGELGDGVMEYSWELPGEYTVAVKKTDSDGSVFISTLRVVVSADTDGDGIVDPFDLDDDGDGVNDDEEFHIREFRTQSVKSIKDGGIPGKENMLILKSVAARGKILGATAKIGIRHEEVNELTVYVGVKSLYRFKIYDREEFGQTLFRSVNLIAHSGGSSAFEANIEFMGYDWYIEVHDKQEGQNTGYIEYFDIEIVHMSDTRDTSGDTDSDGLKDGEELHPGGDGSITDPCDPDTDGDMLLDGKDIVVAESDHRYHLWAGPGYSLDFTDEDGQRRFNGESSLGTSPFLVDTDGDGAADSQDLDPVHDTVLKMEIAGFSHKLSGERNIYFKGVIDNGIGGNRQFETRQMSAREGENTDYSIFGTYYYDITDENTEVNANRIELNGRLYNSKGEDLALKLDGDSSEPASLRYYPKSGELFYKDTIYNRNQDDGITEIILAGCDIDITLRLSLTYADRVNTYLVTAPQTIVPNEDDYPVYVGEESFHMIYLTNSYHQNDRTNNHVILVSEVVYFQSMFHNSIINDDSDSREKWYFNDAVIEKRVFHVDVSPRAVKSVMVLDWVSDVNTLLHDLGHDVEGNDIAIVKDLVPYKLPTDSIQNAKQDLVHRIGLPTGVINMIPTVRKFGESMIFHNADEQSDESGFLSWGRSVCNLMQSAGETFLEWGCEIKDFALDSILPEIAGNLGFSEEYDLSLELYDINIKPFLEEAYGFLIDWLFFGSSHYKYATLQPDSEQDNVKFNHYYSGEGFSLDAISNLAVMFPNFNALLAPFWFMGINNKADTASIISQASTSYSESRSTGFMKYPALGSPDIMTKDEVLELYIEEETPDSTGDWKITLRSRATGDLFVLDTIDAGASSRTDCGLITAELPSDSNAGFGMYDVILEQKEDSQWIHRDTAIHSLQLIEAYKHNPVFVQISDIHVGETGAERDLAKMVAELNARDDLDFILLTGDIVHGGLPIGDIWSSVDGFWDSTYGNVENEWKVLWYILQQLDVPVFATPGNHDYYQSDLTEWVDGDLTWFHKYLVPRFDLKTPSGYAEGDSADYSFNYGEYHFVAVNSGKPLNGGFSTKLAGFTENQLDWIKSDYNDAGGKHTFIFTHAPIVSVQKNDVFDQQVPGQEDFTHESPNDYYFVEWVEDYNPDIEIMLCGHTHHRRFYNDIEIDEERLDKDEYGNPMPDDNGIVMIQKTDDYGNDFSYSFEKTMLVTELG